ncbi:hypothetical protein J3Y65_004412 [Salmonella enterica]|nr:hypothetical protein [Salmonella enterica]
MPPFTATGLTVGRNPDDIGDSNLRAQPPVPGIGYPLTGLCTVSVDNPEPVLSARTMTWQEQVKFSLQDGKYLK